MQRSAHSSLSALGILALFACEAPLPPLERVPSCLDGRRNGQEIDVDCGGICVPCGEGRACQGAADCATDVCRDGRCAAPTCTDGVKNGAEVDRDCGGPCMPCGEGLVCGRAADCTSAVCILNRCVPVSCIDGVKNGDETNKDCGGGCAPCADGLVCGKAADCASGVCQGARCAAPACNDGVKNGDETDKDCGGPCAPCAADRACRIATDCQTRSCTEGRCACFSHLDCGPAGMNCNQGRCAAALASCAAQRAAHPGSSDGEYWIKPGAAPLRAYCDMVIGADLCTEEEGERRGQTREGSALPFVASALYKPDEGICELWALRHPDNNYPYERLMLVAGQTLSTCRALGYRDNGTLSSCAFGSTHGDCGFGVDYYRYGNTCSGCSLNSGSFATYTLQGRMANAAVLTDKAGTVRMRCKTR